MSKYKRVIQMGFDIAEGHNITAEDRESLYNALENVINTFYDGNGNALDFQSVGCYNIEDMSHAYGKEEMKSIQPTEMETTKKPINKIQQIKQFIIDNNPTRKQIIMFIIIDLCGRATEENYVHSDFRGHYSTNITKWKHNGHVEVIDGKYSITDAGMKSDKGFYTLLDSVKIERLEAKVKRLENYEDYRVKGLQKENQRLQDELIYIRDMLKSVTENIEL